MDVIEEQTVSSHGVLESYRDDDALEEEFELHLQKTQSYAPAPNGGLIAWLQVVACFFIFFNTWGIINSFGVFQTIYISTILPKSTNSAISWIGSVQGFILMAGSLFVGPAFDRGYCNYLTYTGTALIVLGMMMTSLCTEYWQFMLAQGICIGIGNGMLFIPGVAIIPTYFTTKRGIATGIAASGSSLGGVIYPALVHNLVDNLGFAWTTRIIGFMMLASMVLVIGCIRVRIMPPRARPIFDHSAFAYRPYTLYNLASFFGFAGVYVPFFYIQQYATDVAGMDEDLAFYSLAIMNASSFFGRVIPGIIADKIGVLNTLFICASFTAILAFCWLAIFNSIGLFVFAIIYGFFSGTFVSLQAPVIAHMCPKMYLLGTWMGMTAFVSGLGLIIGNPVAGAILKDGSWMEMQLYCGVFVAIAAGLVGISRLAKGGMKIPVII